VDENRVRRGIEDGAESALALGKIGNPALHIVGHAIEVVCEQGDFVLAGDMDRFRIFRVGHPACRFQQGGDVPRDEQSPAGEQQQRQEYLPRCDEQALAQNVSAQRQHLLD